MLASTKAAASIFLEFWLVKWTQRVSPRILITGSYVCFAAVSAAYAQSDSAAVLLAIQLVLILGESVGLNHLLTLVARIAPPSMRGRYFAITGLHWDISRAAGPYLGSLVRRRMAVRRFGRAAAHRGPGPVPVPAANGKSLPVTSGRLKHVNGARYDSR